ncbi:MAG: cbb3-type cytochrome oxidase assembly protein CcoS [Campylobacterales bacterium]|nr:cbb3-type cytochrome oxidase assembly protein CcoS [Campylobacterales bacterium]
MSEATIILMLTVSTVLGALGMIALIWGVRTGQFDDQTKFLDGARFDNEEEYKDAVMMEEKKKTRKKEKEEAKKNYMPPD